MSEAPEFAPLSIDELQELFPQYEILSFIAAGGMGSVYLANQNSIDRHVAIKVLPKELSADAEFSTQFRAEAKVMSCLNHPNLIGFFDFGEVNGMFYIIMEFVDGKSLHHSAHGEVIDQDTALNLVIGITEGVEHAHKAGILHRDIKPANILLDSSAFPKLGDFGLARPVEESEIGKVIFGTPGYTAPEVVDDPENIDERSDIYSIGAILYELLTGHLPEENYITPSESFIVDPAFDEVVKKAIAHAPSERYASTSAFLNDLKKIKLYHEQGETVPVKTAPLASTNSPKLLTPTSSKKAESPRKRKSGIGRKLIFPILCLAGLGAAVPFLLPLSNEKKAAATAFAEEVSKAAKAKIEVIAQEKGGNSPEITNGEKEVQPAPRPIVIEDTVLPTTQPVSSSDNSAMSIFERATKGSVHNPNSSHTVEPSIAPKAPVTSSALSQPSEYLVELTQKAKTAHKHYKTELQDSKATNIKNTKWALKRTVSGLPKSKEQTQTNALNAYLEEVDAHGSIIPATSIRASRLNPSALSLIEKHIAKDAQFKGAYDSKTLKLKQGMVTYLNKKSNALKASNPNESKQLSKAAQEISNMKVKNYIRYITQ